MKRGRRKEKTRQEAEERIGKTSHRRKVKGTREPREGTKGQLLRDEEAEQLSTAPPNDGRPLPPRPSSRTINPHSQRGGKSVGTQLGVSQAAGCQPAGADLDSAAEGLPASIGPFFLRSV